jgi:DNA-binding MarR family transcriptional regulator
MNEDKTTELVGIIFKVTRLMKDEMSFSNNLVHLSILQIQTLIFLKCNQDKEVSMSDIAEYFDIELPSATSLVNKLCDLKLVKRNADRNDRRLVIIVLTGGGKKLLDLAMNARRKKLEKILSYLSKKDKLELLNIFKTLANSLQNQKNEK